MKEGGDRQKAISPMSDEAAAMPRESSAREPVFGEEEHARPVFGNRLPQIAPFGMNIRLSLYIQPFCKVYWKCTGKEGTLAHET